MNRQIVISGVGGQGVLFITRLLAQAFMDGGSPVLTSETHGMAQRGGIVISHLKGGDFQSPLIRPGHADLLIALKTETLDQHCGFLKQNGEAVVNAANGAVAGRGLEGITIKTVDADRLAETDNSPGSVNLYMLGAALSLGSICSMDSVKEQVRLRLAKKEEIVVQSALSALDRGFSAVNES